MTEHKDVGRASSNHGAISQHDLIAGVLSVGSQGDAIPNREAEDDWEFTSESYPGVKPCPTCGMTGVVKDATRNREAKE